MSDDQTTGSSPAPMPTQPAEAPDASTRTPRASTPQPTGDTDDATDATDATGAPRKRRRRGSRGGRNRKRPGEGTGGSDAEGDDTVPGNDTADVHTQSSARTPRNPDDPGRRPGS
ncbi:MAG: hypothetical protein ACXW2C_12885, partial [Acidimicrobiia bacterium]